MCGDVAGSQEGCDVETGRAVEEQTISFWDDS